MTAEREQVLDRFLRYVSFDTQSSYDCKTAPSTSKQLALAEQLAKELKEIGISNARVTDKGIVYASIPASNGCGHLPAIGFNSHMDTSPDASGADVKPRIVKFTGEDICLNPEKSVYLGVGNFPELKKYIGQEIVVTDGNTLLGADDKAGIAAIMTMADWVVKHPEVPHAKICISFTPDEEVARGTESFDLKEFGADYAFTIDGGELGCFQYENFNAASAQINIQGVGVHPGTAKGKMVNAIRLAHQLIDNLPGDETPETTEGHQGFFHVNSISASVTHTEMNILIRDHDRDNFEKRIERILELVKNMQDKYPKALFSVDIKRSYQNMLPFIMKQPWIIHLARKAYEACGVEICENPIRGGTDGAELSARGLPCPNIFTGGLNCHGIYECLPVPSLQKAADVAIELARLSTEVPAKDTN